MAGFLPFADKLYGIRLPQADIPYPQVAYFLDTGSGIIQQREQGQVTAAIPVIRGDCVKD